MEMRIASICVLCGLCASAEAGWIATARFSSVSADADGQGPTLQSTNFNSFDQTVTKSGPGSSASCSQQSSMLANGMRFVSNTRVSATGSFTASSHSYFTVTYTLDAPTQYSLSGANGGKSIAFLFGIRDIVNNVNVVVMDQLDGPFNVQGVLAAGKYTIGFTLTDSAGAGYMGGPANADATFQFIPAPSGGVVLGCGLILAARRRRG